jgi:hypothetical protein
MEATLTRTARRIHRTEVSLALSETIQLQLPDGHISHLYLANIKGEVCHLGVTAPPDVEVYCGEIFALRDS